MNVEVINKPKMKGPKINIKKDRVEMMHGSGGKAMQKLIEQIFLPAFDNPYLNQLNDQALISIPGGRIAVATDAHVISPLFFPGGDIGSLAVHGTINDLAMGGAVPRYLTSSFILEEGFPFSDLQKIVDSMAKAARNTGIYIVAGDTKVVEKGKGDGIFITTTGVGVVPEFVKIKNKIQAGDKIILSGYIGDHGVAVMSKRNNLEFQTVIQSDSCALHTLTAQMLKAVPSLHALRDPTRGGVAAVLNEWATQHEVGFIIDESAIPVRDEVLGACELFGIDPLYVANEGKLLVACKESDAAHLLKVMKAHPLGIESTVIGTVVEDPSHFVELNTSLGGRRMIDWLSGDQLPRIC